MLPFFYVPSKNKRQEYIECDCGYHGASDYRICPVCSEPVHFEGWLNVAIIISITSFFIWLFLFSA